VRVYHIDEYCQDLLQKRLQHMMITTTTTIIIIIIIILIIVLITITEIKT